MELGFPKRRNKLKGVVTVTDGLKRKIVKEIKVDLAQAIKYGHTLRPRMRLLDISRRKREIDKAT